MENEQAFRVEQSPTPPKLVCVTGAAGFVASWLVKLLLDRGYQVRGTVRDPTNASHTKHLTSLAGAERLKLVRADILDRRSIDAAVGSCAAVFHTACPVQRIFQDPWKEILEPAVSGTMNVLEAAAAAGSVTRVVMTSSIGTVYMNRDRSRDAALDESCWSDAEYLLESQEWYCLAKTLAEKAAWKVAAERGIELVTVVPPLVLGPVLEPRVNASSMHVLKYISGRVHTYTNMSQAYVDVRDVAAAHLLALESESASGRYLCVASVMHRSELVEAIANLFPEFNLAIKSSDPLAPKAVPLKFITGKVVSLGVKFRSFEKSLQESINSYIDTGLIDLNH